MDKQAVSHRVKAELGNWFSQVGTVSCSRCQSFQTAVHIDTHWEFETDIKENEMPGNRSAGLRCNDRSQALHHTQQLAVNIDQGKHPEWIHRLQCVFSTADADKALNTVCKDEEDFGLDGETFSYLNSCGGCGGDGNVTCGSCSGQGEVKCSSCYGSAQVNCGFCHGSGTYRDGINPESRCSRCSGGKVSCSVCHSGTRTCGGCLGQGRVRCRPCEGTGCFTNEFQVQVRAKASRRFAWNNTELPNWTNTYLEQADRGGVSFLPWQRALSFNPGKVTIDTTSYPLACSAVATVMATEADVTNEGVERECHFLSDSLHVIDLGEIADKNAEKIASALTSAGNDMDEINSILSQNVYRASLKAKDGHGASEVDPVRKRVISQQALDTLLNAYRPVPERLKKVGKSVKALPWLKRAAWSFLGLFLVATLLQFAFSADVDVTSWSLVGLADIPSAFIRFYAALFDGYVGFGFLLRFGAFALVVYFLAEKLLLPRLARKKRKRLLNYLITFHVLFAALPIVEMPVGDYDLILLNGGGMSSLLYAATLTLQAIPVLIMFSLVLGWMLARRASDAVVFDFVQQISIPELAKDLGYRR